MKFDSESPRPSLLAEEVRLIPAWSVVLAVVMFAFAQYFVFVLMRHPHSDHRPPVALRIFWSISWGVVIAMYALLIGYISRDTKRRRMSSGLWMAAAVLMPGAIGTVVYFLLRQPLVSPCPACSSPMEAGANFCSQCRFQMALCCRQCYRSVLATDVYCSRCGNDLATDPVPARLRELAL